ncbi:SDR family oxidoreductase [Actinokineospora sp. PR83]|uniref:SDR family oxidoreductase n=1 Tax=Actinokineospora sp. PR83 TaxID=2884908 RepID=UPI001F26FED1|nr:SDR family oxidoreductase [Actinokineospora sp. PR83]MCG8917192.1 SDR family oxidoreductase [Actinokineospora sp. PR83]
MSSRSAFVTGANRGIGAAIARDLVERGHRVVGTHRGTGPEVDGVSFVRCDVRDPESVAAAVREAREVVGEIDIVVSSAGVTRDGLLMAQTPDEVSGVLDTNLAGAFNVVREAVSDMVTNKWGRIVFVSSVMGLWGSPGQSTYSASKSGLVGLARSLAWELGRKRVTANVVLPGLIETDMIAGLADRRREQVIAQTPLRRTGTPEEVAALVGFLVSEEAGFITGASVPISGGVGMGL